MNGPFYIHHRRKSAWLDAYGNFGPLNKATSFATREGAKAFIKKSKEDDIVIATIPEVKW